MSGPSTTSCIPDGSLGPVTEISERYRSLAAEFTRC